MEEATTKVSWFSLLNENKKKTKLQIVNTQL